MIQKCECALTGKQPDGFPKSLLKRCCCTCKHRFTLCGHPWVDGKNMSDVVGYACGIFWMFDGQRRFVMNQEHGVCECHEHEEKVNKRVKRFKKGRGKIV
jgi:hypothetical protein